MRKLVLLLTLLLTAVSLLNAQETRTLSGKVIDENGEPLIGAGVMLPGGTRGTVTDLDGNVHDYVSIYDTSYGEAAGIFGINCGHFPETFISGLSVPRYEKLSQAELEKNGEAYEKSQVQRKLERDVRDAKTYAKALEAAGDKVGYSAQLKKVQEKRAAYAAYCLENGLDERTDKLVVHGFKRGNNG